MFPHLKSDTPSSDGHPRQDHILVWPQGSDLRQLHPASSRRQEAAGSREIASVAAATAVSSRHHPHPPFFLNFSLFHLEKPHAERREKREEAGGLLSAACQPASQNFWFDIDFQYIRHRALNSETGQHDLSLALAFLSLPLNFAALFIMALARW